MNHLPLSYRWLAGVGGMPLMIGQALKLTGVAEGPGPADNPDIIDWARILGGEVARDYRADSIPWCGLFMAIVAKRAGKPVPAKPLWALNWTRFGVAVDDVPVLGDVLVFVRPSGGHVGLYVGEDSAAFHVLGGNQSDRVGFTRIARGRLRAARRPVYARRPTGARPYRLAVAGGPLSTNEA